MVLSKVSSYNAYTRSETKAEIIKMESQRTITKIKQRPDCLQTLLRLTECRKDEN